MQISVITLFPELYEPFVKTSLVGRAVSNKIINFDAVSLFSFAKPKERIDSPSFGPGAGMLLKPEIVSKAIDPQEEKFGRAFKIFFSPQGKKLNQKLLNDILDKVTKNNNHLLLMSSRYEGVDKRVEDYYADDVISVGDFVLMGGDLPAMCLIESLLRLVPKVIGKEESVQNESFYGPFIDYPEFTDPVEWKGIKVPDIIRSGNHALIDKWRTEQAVKTTVEKHFEWLRSHSLTLEQKKLSAKFIPDHYAILMHGDVLLKDGCVGTTSVTSLDIHDIARSCTTYGIKNYFISTPLLDQQSIVRTLIDFWIKGVGAEYNVSRAESIKKVILINNLNEAVKEIEKNSQKTPILIATSAKDDPKYKEKRITYYDQTKIWSYNRPVLFLFGTGHGISNEILDKCDYILEPIIGFSNFNHLSVRSATAVILDRWMGINVKRD